MDIQEMHLSVQQGVDKIHAQVADSILSTELDRELNKAIQQFVTTRFQQNNTYRKGFEETQKRRDDLRTLVTEAFYDTQFKEILRGANGDLDFIAVDTWEIPSNYMYLINLNAQIHRNSTCTELAYNLIDQEPTYYFLMDLNDFVGQNQLNDSTQWVSQIQLLSDIAAGQLGATELAWEWGSDVNENGWTGDNLVTVFPESGESMVGSSQIDAGQATNEGLIQDILLNWTLDGDIWWETFQNQTFPGQFIVTVPIDTYTFLNSDSSLGAVTYLAGLNDENLITVQTPLIFASDVYGAKRHALGPIQVELYPCKLVQHDDIIPMIDDPFNKTKYSSPLAVMRGRWIDIYTDDKFIVEDVKLTYLRQPATVSLGLNRNCDLPLHTHEEIVRLAVNSILETISDPRSATHQLQVDKME